MSEDVRNWEYWRMRLSEGGFLRVSEDQLPSGLVWSKYQRNAEIAQEEGALGAKYLRRRASPPLSESVSAARSVLPG